MVETIWLVIALISFIMACGLFIFAIVELYLKKPENAIKLCSHGIGLLILSVGLFFFSQFFTRTPANIYGLFFKIIFFWNKELIIQSVILLTVVSIWIVVLVFVYKTKLKTKTRKDLDKLIARIKNKKHLKCPNCGNNYYTSRFSLERLDYNSFRGGEIKTFKCSICKTTFDIQFGSPNCNNYVSEPFNIKKGVKNNN